jgi:hypothetical protein
MDGGAVTGRSGDALAGTRRDGACDDFAQTLGHDFGRPELLAEALTHPSARPLERRPGRRRKAGRQSYERLEFLGDRVLARDAGASRGADRARPAFGAVAR